MRIGVLATAAVMVAAFTASTTAMSATATSAVASEGATTPRPAADVVRPVPGWVALRPHQTFTVMSYNLLHPTQDDEDRNWTVRLPAIVKLIRANDPDLFGVQEATKVGDYVPADDLQAEFGDEYGRSAAVGGSPKHVYYRTSRFEQVATDAGYYDNLDSSTEPCRSNAKSRSYAWSLLKDRKSGRLYLAVNTHFAHGSCPAERNNQASQLVRQIDARLEQFSEQTPSVILTGDLNSDAQRPSPVKGDRSIAILETGGEHFHLFRSARHTGETAGATATFNRKWDASRDNDSARLDYILHSGGDLTSLRPTIDRGRYGLSGFTPSDHYAVTARLGQADFRPGAEKDAHDGGSDPETELYFADVDGDGCADKISWNRARNDGKTITYPSSCDGTFGAGIQHNNGYSKGVNTWYLFGDVNGDGRADKIYWNATFDGGAARVYLGGKVTGLFAAKVISNGNVASTTKSARYALAEIDDDDCADLAFWSPERNDGKVRIALSECDGTFAAPISVDAGSRSTSTGTHFYFADVTGDGMADMIRWNRKVDGGKTRIWRATGNGGFVDHDTPGGGYGTTTESRFYFADLDGDGAADKVHWRPLLREGRPQIYPSDGTTFRGYPSMDNVGYSQGKNTQYYFADITGDGAADQIYWNPYFADGVTRAYLSWS